MRQPTDKITFWCSGCKKGIIAPVEKAGKTAKCPACGIALQIPNTPGQDHAASPAAIPPAIPQVAATAPGGDGDRTLQPSTERINFACSGCGKAILAPADRAGKTGRCPACGVAIQIPQTPDYYKANLAAACAALGKGFELQEQEEHERADKGFELAEKWVREVLQTPCLPLVIEPEANCLLGTCLRCRGRFAEAKPALEKGLALARNRGLVLNEEWFYADDLGVVYDQAVQLLIIEGQLDQAKALFAQVESFVSHYRSLEKFERERHEGFILLARGMIAAGERRWDAAVQNLGQLLRSPYKEYFSSQESLKFVIGQACRNIGRIYHFAYGRSDEAMPYFEESLKYFPPDDEGFADGQVFLDRIRRKRGLVRAICSGCDRIAWGSSLDDFLQTFPRARPDDDWWLSGEEPGDLAGFAVNLVKYAFNQNGQLFLIAFFPSDPPSVDAELPDVLGAPCEAGKAVWKYGHVEVSLKGGGHVVTLINSAFDDDAGGEGVPAAALAALAHGWNGLPWGTTLPEFQRRFPEAYIDGPCWLTGEGEERFERIRMPTTKYMFNAKGQFYLVAFYPPDEVDLLDGDYASHLLGTFGNPDGAKGTSWSHGTVVLKATQNCLVLVNTAFDNDPIRSREGWTGKPRPRGA